MGHRACLVISLALAAAGLLGMVFSYIPARVDFLTFPVEGGITASGLLFEPPHLRESASKAPVVFLLPGINNYAEWYRAMALELTRKGYCAFALNLSGLNTRTHLKVVQGAARYLAAHNPEADTGKKALFGHSYGAIPAIEAAYYDSTVRAVVTVGYYIGGEVNRSPSNLLVGTGAHDDLNGPGILREMIASFTDGAVKTEGIRVGSFEQRTAMELFISPSSNHASEKEDYYVVKRLIEWLDYSFYGALQGPVEVKYPLFTLSAAVFMAGLFPLLTLGAMGIFTSQGRGGFLLWTILLVAGGALFYIPGITPLLGGCSFFLLIMAGLTASYYSPGLPLKEGGRRFAASVLSGAGAMLLLASSLVLSDFIFACPVIFSAKSCLSGYPDYLFVSYFLLPLISAEALLRVLQRAHPLMYFLMLLPPLAVWGLEWCRPGFAGGLFMKMLSFFSFKKGIPVPPRQGVLLLILCGAAVFFWARVFSGGLGHVVKAYLTVLARFLVLPATFFLLAIAAGKAWNQWAKPRGKEE
ncbi:MAG: hypothetical protein RDV48_02290 [Candidatus Eremiobacteraeota bacterium]|nr:hypothetical protein [Candidatus Eremiobacteraeota bacterium]